MVVKYLKVMSVVIQQVSAGYKISDLTPLGMRISRDKSGLPRIIPSYQRKLMRSGDKQVIKFWLTMASIYRDLNFNGKLKLTTITSPGPDPSTYSPIFNFIRPFAISFMGGVGVEFSPRSSVFQILTSGPQVATETKDGFHGWNSEYLSVCRS